MKKVFVIASVAAMFLAASVGVVLAAAGPGPQAKQRVAEASETQTVAVSGEVPPPNPLSPLATSIPGCVCHSDDPALVEQHSSYRMNQCFGCHGETPTGQ